MSDRTVDPEGVDAAEPLDASDLRLLQRIVDLYDLADPMPDLLPDLVLFALQDADLDAELAHLVAEEAVAPALAGARTVEQARRVTFSSEHLTVMISLQDRGDGSVRVDGWSAPGGGLRAELRTGQDVLSATCDTAGRFVFDAVPAGPAQLTLLPTAASDPSVPIPVVTPAITL